VRLPDPLAEALIALDQALSDDRREGRASIGSSNHMTEVITIRLVGRSMCSQAASALDFCSRVRRKRRIAGEKYAS
jgi:hypothetical protein